MATATFSVRTDDFTKSCFSEFCKSAGLSISTAINLFMKTVIKQNKIPFEITGEPKISDDPFWQIPENVEALKKSVKQLEEGKCSIHELIEVEV